jgi:hypothetical protein
MKTIEEKMRNLNAILKPVYFLVFFSKIILMPFLDGNNSKRSNTKPNSNKPGRLNQKFFNFGPSKTKLSKERYFSIVKVA